jgi:hypothetical protein
MISGDISELALYDALNLCEFMLVSGTLQATSATRSGSVYLSNGRLAFAEIEGRGTASIDAERSGVDPSLWSKVAIDPENRGSIASILIERGADPESLRRFIRRRIENVVAELALATDLTLDLKLEPGWFGEEITFPISSVIDSARVINFGGELVGDATGHALIAFCQVDSGSVTLGAEEWNALADLLAAVDLGSLRDRLGPDRAVRFVRFFQSRSLATAITAMPDLA